MGPAKRLVKSVRQFFKSFESVDFKDLTTTNIQTPMTLKMAEQMINVHSCPNIQRQRN